jgi:hypothetical protein
MGWGWEQGGLVVLWDDVLLAEAGEEVEEAVVGGLVVEEAELAALAHVGDDFDGTAEVGVGVPGGGEVVEVGFGEMVTVGDVAPDWFGVGELLLEGGAFAGEGRGFDAEPLGEAGPHPAPAEDVAVDDVEGLVAGGGRGGGPLEMAGEETGVGHVGEAVPLGCGAGEEEGAIGLAAEGGVGGEGDAHVHGVAESVADDGVGAVDAPCEVVAGGGGEDFVFLGVVEVVDGEAGLFFTEGRGGEGAFAVGFEGSEVVLEAGDERGVLEGAGGGDGFEEVAHHGAVDADVLFFGGLAEPGGDEDVGGFECGDGGAEGGGVEEVGGDEVDAGDVGGGAAGEAVDVPAFGEELVGEVVADDAGDSGD